MRTTYTNKLKIKLFDRIQDITPGPWNDLVNNHSCTFSHEFWDLVEQSSLNDFRYRHALFLDENDMPVALTSFYSITTDIAIFAPAGLRGVLTKIRRFFPNFLKLSMLECGTPITLNSPPFVARNDTNNSEIMHALHGLLHSTAKAEGQLLIIIRDFEPNAHAMRPQLEQLGYHWVPGLPNTYMDIPWATPEHYRASMKSYYRSKLLKHLRKNQTHNVRYELVTDFYDLADTLCQQWLVVHNQADEFQREVLTPDFYRAFSRNMGKRSKTILYYRGDELVGHALLLLDGDLLRWLYFGRKEAVNDSLYIYVGHSVIETAILLDAKRLELGLTTYSIKQDLGAQVTPIHMALRGASALINPFVGFFYPLLNSVPKTQNKNIFKTGD